MSGGGKTQTSTSSVQIPPEVLARYNAVNARAENVASTPFQAYSYDPNAFVAPMTETQNAAIGQIGQASGMAQPYFQTGAAATLGGMGPANLGELDTNKYMSPYLQNVVQNTADILGQQNRQDMSGALGTAIQSGAGFGDRSGIAAANLNRQQMMGMGSTIGNLLNQGYTQAQGVAQQQQSADLASRQANLARLLQGGQNIGQLGAGAQGAALAGSQALLGAGTQEQQTEQAGKSALYNQYQQERAYPFQVSQFLGNLAMGTGALSGSTTQTTSPAGFFSGFKDGGKVIEGVGYRRGGLVPESMGGHVNAGHMGEGYADGGSPQADYATMVMQQLFGGMDPNAGAYGRGSAGIGSGGFVPQANLPVGQLMIANPVEGPAQTNASDLVDMASSLTDTGEKAGDLWDEYGPKSSGGRTGLAAGGIPYDPSGSGYVPVQEPGTQKTPELLQPKDPQQPESGLSKVADLAKIVGMFMANGGVAGRRGYAGGGFPDDALSRMELARRKAASGLSYDPGRQNLPPEGVTVPTPGRETAEAYYLNRLRAAPAGAAVTTTPGLSGADAERIRREYYTSLYEAEEKADRPVQLLDDQRSDIGLFPTGSDLEFFNAKVATPPPARIRELPFNLNASVQGAQAGNSAYVGPDAATRLFGAATGEDSAVDTAMRVAANAPAAVADTFVRAVDSIFLGPAELSQKYPTATPQPDYIGGVSPAWSRSMGARAEDRSDLNVFNPYASVQGAQIGQPQSEVMETVERGLTLPPYIAPDPDSELRNVSPVANIPPIPMPRLDRSGLGAASPAVPAAATPVAAGATTGDLTSGVTPLTFSTGEAKAAEPFVEPQPGLAAGTGTGAPAVGPGVDAASVIRVFEGFSPETYWDVNHHRGGYGSDTITRADGTVEEVKRGMTFSREDAERDLSRRIAESQTGISKKIGADVWSALPGNTQTALTSIAYNYGSLPNSVAEAARSGDQEKIAVAIEALGGHNDGVNRARRYKEAALVRGGALSDFSGGSGGSGGGTLGDAAITPPDVTDTRPGGGGGDNQPAPGLGGGNFLEQMIAKAGGPENIILPFLSGLGKMAGSQSRFLGTALLEGVGGGAEAYMNRQKQLADIAGTKATAFSNISTALSNMLVKDATGNVFVPLQNGDYQLLWDYMDNPKGQSILGQQADRLLSELSPAQLREIVRTAPDAVEGGEVPPQTPVSEGVSNIVWSPNSDRAISDDKAMARSQGRQAYLDQSINDYKTVRDMAGNAVSNAQDMNVTINTVADALANPPAAQPGPAGAWRSWVDSNIKFLANIVGVDASSLGDMSDQSAVLNKLATMSAGRMLPEGQNALQALQQYISSNPNMDMPPEAMKTITVSLMQANQQALEKNAYYRNYMQRSGGFNMGADQAFYSEIGRLHQQEHDQLMTILGEAELVKKLTSGISFEEAQARIQHAFAGNVSPVLARFFAVGAY